CKGSQAQAEGSKGSDEDNPTRICDARLSTCSPLIGRTSAVHVFSPASPAHQLGGPAFYAASIDSTPRTALVCSLCSSASKQDSDMTPDAVALWPELAASYCYSAHYLSPRPVWIHSRAAAARAGCDLPLSHATEDGRIGETSASGAAPIAHQVLALESGAGLVLGWCWAGAAHADKSPKPTPFTLHQSHGMGDGMGSGMGSDMGRPATGANPAARMVITSHRMTAGVAGACMAFWRVLMGFAGFCWVLLGSAGLC
ncbi:hypothetical protein AOQ84DRAFT_411384, partial [Glonium stellatum]